MLALANFSAEARSTASPLPAFGVVTAMGVGVPEAGVDAEGVAIRKRWGCNAHLENWMRTSLRIGV